jgi:DNA-binding transcriptional LysR family regulator
MPLQTHLIGTLLVQTEVVVELRQLEYFVAVAEERHFTRAAARLHVAQPSVSQQIKTLERELAVTLFDRSNRTVALTPAGSEILPLATQLLSDARRLRQHAELSARRLAGRIRIGFLADEYTHPVADRFIGSIRTKHPDLTFEFHQVGFTEQYAALDDAQVDVAFVAGPVPEPYAAVPLFKTERLLAVSRAGAEDGSDARHGDFAHTAVVLPNQITDETWRVEWTPPRSAPTQTFVVGENSMEAMLSAVGAGRGVCIVPEYVSRYYPQPAVRFLALRELAPCAMAIAALGSRLNEPAIGALLHEAQVARRGRAGSNPERVMPPPLTRRTPQSHPR